MFGNSKRIHELEDKVNSQSIALKTLEKDRDFYRREYWRVSDGHSEALRSVQLARGECRRLEDESDTLKAQLDDAHHAIERLDNDVARLLAERAETEHVANVNVDLNRTVTALRLGMVSLGRVYVEDVTKLLALLETRDV